ATDLVLPQCRALNMLPCSLPHAVAQVGVGKKLAKGLRHVTREFIGRRDLQLETACLINGSARAAATAHDQREAVAHCLQCHVPTRFPIARKYEDVGHPVVLHHRLSRLVAPEPNTVCQTSFPRDFLTGCTVGTITNDVEHEG